MAVAAYCTATRRWRGHYLHDSPYTYFTSDELHLGEISLECSRAGAAAGALWLTLQLLPLSAEDGLVANIVSLQRGCTTLAHRTGRYAANELGRARLGHCLLFSRGQAQFSKRDRPSIPVPV